MASYVTVPVLRLPEQATFINACGLNAIKISLGAHMPTAQIPFIATIGVAVDDGDWISDGLEAEDIPRMRDYLSTTLTNYNPAIVHRYRVGASNRSDNDIVQEAVAFRNKVIPSNGMGLTMIFGVWTYAGFPDWQVVAPHIVTVYGYSWNAQRTQSWIHWVDGNNMLSGHRTAASGLGAYYNTMATRTLWESYADDNDFQIYHLAGG